MIPNKALLGDGWAGKVLLLLIGGIIHGSRNILHLKAEYKDCVRLNAIKEVNTSFVCALVHVELNIPGATHFSTPLHHKRVVCLWTTMKTFLIALCYDVRGS